MEQALDKRIRERAYALWLAHGRAEGQAEQHWLTAEREVLSTMMAQPSAPGATAARKPRNRQAASTPAKARAAG